MFQEKSRDLLATTVSYKYHQNTGLSVEIIFGYFFFRCIDLMFKGKSFTEFTNLFSAHNFEKKKKKKKKKIKAQYNHYKKFKKILNKMSQHSTMLTKLWLFCQVQAVVFPFAHLLLSLVHLL